VTGLPTSPSYCTTVTYVIHSCRRPRQRRFPRISGQTSHGVVPTRGHTLFRVFNASASAECIGRRRRSQQSRRRVTHGMSASRRLKWRSGQAQVFYTQTVPAKFHRCTVPTLLANPDYATDAYINSSEEWRATRSNCPGMGRSNPLAHWSDQSSSDKFQPLQGFATACDYSLKT